MIHSSGSTTSPRTIWTVMREWAAALPSGSPEAETRQEVLQKKLDRSFFELTEDGREDYSNVRGAVLLFVSINLLGPQYVIGHNDLLSANVIIPSGLSIEESDSPVAADDPSYALARKVHFIDYEYAALCPAAFDLANHFSEWAGYDCDYNILPTQATRRRFIAEYLRSYSRYASLKTSVEQLCHEVDRYRGMPGFYWGVQALIQDAISDVKFDWTSYAEVRLAEFWAWRREIQDIRAQAGEAMSLRELRWARPA